MKGGPASRARRAGVRRTRAVGPLIAALLLACAPGRGETQRDAAPPAGPALRVGTSGDYAPFSTGPEPRGARSSLETERAEAWGGFDVALARRFAGDRGRALRLVRFRWPRLTRDLTAGRFDVAMGGITVRPERSLAGRFSVPVAEGGAVALVPRARAPAGPDPLALLDREGVVLAVNAGGHLERVARARFPRARILAIPDNAAVPERLAQGAADAVVTDVFEAPHWERRLEDAGPLEGVVRLGPFTRDRKAALLPAEAGALAADLDTWLLAREAAGDLAALRRAHLGPEHAGPVATPLAALVAALDERLALMPRVAEAKRRSGAPVHVPAQERRVVEAARRAVAKAARDAGRPPPADAAVERFFRAQFAAARALQKARLAWPPAAGPPPDLERALRPALLRIGARMARLLVRLPAGGEAAAAADPRAAQRFVLARLTTPGLPERARSRLAQAVAALAAGGDAGAR